MKITRLYGFLLYILMVALFYLLIEQFGPLRHSLGIYDIRMPAEAVFANEVIDIQEQYYTFFKYSNKHGIKNIYLTIDDRDPEPSVLQRLQRRCPQRLLPGSAHICIDRSEHERVLIRDKKTGEKGIWVRIYTGEVCGDTTIVEVSRYIGPLDAVIGRVFKVYKKNWVWKLIRINPGFIAARCIINAYPEC